ACIPPTLTKIAYRFAIITREYKFVSLFTLNTGGEQRVCLICHFDSTESVDAGECTRRDHMHRIANCIRRIDVRPAVRQIGRVAEYSNHSLRDTRRPRGYEAIDVWIADSPK